MKILRELISETTTAGAVSAGAIAGFRGSLFPPSKKREKDKNSKNKIRIIKFSTKAGIVKESERKFDAADVISKLKASEKRNELDKDAVAFGMENEDGDIVKVYVRTEQAEDFEKALAQALGQEDEDENETNSALEIAEVLFKLRDKFDIVDVEWPEITGDEEEEVEEEPGVGDEEVPTEEPGMGEEPEATEPSDTSDAKSALDKVIDMLKANADAEKAKAEATKAEAEAKQAEANARAAEAKVKQEEEVLDMEAYYKDKATADKETKQLAKLAQWKHDIKKDAGDDLPADAEPVTLSADEEEELTKVGTTPKSLTREKFLDFLKNHLKGDE